MQITQDLRKEAEAMAGMAEKSREFLEGRRRSRGRGGEAMRAMSLALASSA
jgi:hypothetical protein